MKKTANLLVTAYLLLLFVVYPFYMKEGYVEIGRAKYSFWIRISLSTAAVLLLFFVIRRDAGDRRLCFLNFFVELIHDVVREEFAQCFL